MSKAMTTHERVSRMFAHQEADRIPIIDGPWADTVARWQREGMPESASYVDYFGLDKVEGIFGLDVVEHHVPIRDDRLHFAGSPRRGLRTSCFRKTDGVKLVHDFLLHGDLPGFHLVDLTTQVQSNRTEPVKLVNLFTDTHDISCDVANYHYLIIAPNRPKVNTLLLLRYYISN